MQSITLIVFAVVMTMALAEGQYYIPRAYYTIDAEGHVSEPVSLRRLRRSLSPYPYNIGGGANANAHAHAEANAWGGHGHADANANAHASAGGFGLPIGAGNPNVVRH